MRSFVLGFFLSDIPIILLMILSISVFCVTNFGSCFLLPSIWEIRGSYITEMQGSCIWSIWFVSPRLSRSAFKS